MSFFSYRGVPQPSPARSRYTPRGSIVQQPGDYAQHSGISHPGGAGFVSEAPQGARLRQAEYVWFPLYRFFRWLISPWRSSDWFRAVDQDGNGHLSREELRMRSPV